MNNMDFDCWIRELKSLFGRFGNKVQQEKWVPLYLSGLSPIMEKQAVERYMGAK